MNSSPSNWADAFKSILRRPSFLVVGGILLIAAITLNTAAQYMQLHFQKIPVEMAASFDTIPEKLGHWVQVSKDEPLPPDAEHVLAATHYIYRDYVDDRKIRPEQIKAFAEKTFRERKIMLATLQAYNPTAVITVGLTYYTGMVDTVAHIPDRCYIADGYEPSSYKIVAWSAFEDRPGRDAHNPPEDVRYINFEDQVASRQNAPRNVAYFFHANGEYTSDPIGVRLRLQDLRQRYGYYAKIEMMTVMNDADESARIMNDYLTSALPEIEKCLPDWKKVTQPQAKTSQATSSQAK
jgi:hypothetical protein